MTEVVGKVWGTYSQLLLAGTAAADLQSVVSAENKQQGNLHSAGACLVMIAANE